jgi:hypothetical protein
MGMNTGRLARLVEDTINEGKDADQIADTLVNAMEEMDEKGFVEFLSDVTKVKAPALKKIFKAYWDMDPMAREDLGNPAESKAFLKQFGVK